MKNIIIQIGLFCLLFLPKYIQASDFSDFKILKNIPYGQHSKQTLDIYLPNKITNAPVFVMVHGGGWRIGDKDMGRVVDNKVNHWVKRGVIFISVNYRLLPEATPLEQAQDVALAISYVQKNITSFGGNTQKLIIMGHSAGAHLVSLITSDISYYKNLQKWSGSIILDSAILDVPTFMNNKHLKLYDEAFGKDTKYWEEASPYHKLKQKSPPMFIVCSEKRLDKPCLQAESFTKKANSLNIKTEILYTDMSHKEINEELGKNKEYTKKVDNFINSLGITF